MSHTVNLKFEWLMSFHVKYIDYNKILTLKFYNVYNDDCVALLSLIDRWRKVYRLDTHMSEALQNIQSKKDHTFSQSDTDEQTV